MATPVTMGGDVKVGPGGPRPGSIAPNGLFGMLVFILTEAMMFAGFISAFAIAKATASVWPPPDQPRLPVEATAFNTAMLLISAFLLIVAHRSFHRGDRAAMRKPLWAAVGFGAFFVLFQGYEWISLISQGLTLTSSALGGFFYTIIGMHALHAIAAIGLLGYACMRLQRGFLTPSLFGAAEALWLFVVGVWPILYWVVYL